VGTAVDATIIPAPSSTKNSNGKRDPEMRQTRKGNQWYFGTKAHIDVDAETGVVHSMATTPANHHDITETDKLLHGEEEDDYADSGYRGIERRPEHQERKVNWHIAMMPGKRKHLDKESPQELLEQAKASIRAKVEHPFRIIKQQFGFIKARYRGMRRTTTIPKSCFPWQTSTCAGVSWQLEGVERPDYITARRKQKNLDCIQNLRKWLQSERKIGKVGVFQTLLSL